MYPKFQVITIVNYDKYQDVTGKTPYKQQATNRQATGKQQQLKNKEKEEKERSILGRCAPDSPSGIPERYKGRFKTEEEYLAWRNQ